MKSVAAAILLTGLLAFAEDDAVTLLGGAASVAATTRTFHAEGTLDQKGSKPARFRIWYRQSPPAQARLEFDDGPNSFTRVCDGVSQYTLYPKLDGYVRVALPAANPCAWPLVFFPSLQFNIKNPRIMPTKRVQANGRMQNCMFITGKDHVLCMNADGDILFFQNDTDKYTFSLMERNPALAADLFQPPVSHEISAIYWTANLPPPDPANPASRVSNELPAPLLRIAVPPANRGEGDMLRPVLLYVEIDRAGVPRLVRVVGSLGPEIDQRAIDAVRQWRFGPTAEPLATAIAINFRP